MRFLYLAFILSLCIFSCQQPSKKATDMSQLIPKDAAVILKINDLETFRNDISNSDFTKRISNTATYEAFQEALKQFEDFKSSVPVVLAFGHSKDSISYTFITKQTSKTDSLNLKLPYVKVIDSFYIASNSQKTIVPQIQDNAEVASLFKISDPEKSFSILLKSDLTNMFGDAFFVDTSQNFGDWTVLDAHISPNQITLNGLVSNTTSTQKLSTVFNGNIPQENHIQNIVPIQSEGFSSFTYHDYQTLKQHLDLYNGKAIDSTHTSELFETVHEIGEIYLEQASVIVLRSIDAAATKEALRQHQNSIENFRGSDILQLEDSLLLKNTFKPLLSKTTTSYIALDDFFVFSHSIDPLKTIISNYQNGTVLSNNDAFNTNFAHLSDESSALVIASPKRLNKQLQQLFQVDKNFELDAYKFSAFQWIEDDGYAHVNSIINKSKKRALANTISEEFTITLESDVLNTPQFVTNHRTKQKEIVVQDINNQLYLISNTGKILWKKRLNGPVLGNIEQVDLYKNGRLQLAFATPKRMYILDRNGNDVGPFPIKFNDDITQPLSVFDYDKNKNYRFLIAQDKDLLMLDRKGKTVRGFNYKKDQSITKQPKHFRVRNKDYIVFASNNKMKILNRRGDQRINVKETVNFSENPIFLYKNTFATTTQSGELTQTNLKGAVSKQALGLDTSHKIDATSKTLVSLSNNQLHIKQNTYELEYGDYSLPKIFYLNDKIYVSVTDRQSQKVYLFDSNAKLQNNFPVFGNSTIDLNNIDNDRNLEFVTIGDSNSIIVYKKN